MDSSCSGRSRRRYGTDLSGLANLTWSRWYANADEHTYSDANGDADKYADRYADRHTGWDAYSDVDTYGDSDFDADSNADSSSGRIVHYG